MRLQKDSSQETVISLMGMLVSVSLVELENAYADLYQAGSFVVARVSSPMATWSCLILLLSIHLAINRAAVRAVAMHTLNRQRANIVFSEYVSKGKVLSPADVSARERIFERDGVLRWNKQSPIGKAVIGGSLEDLVKSVAGPPTVTGAVRDNNVLTKIAQVFSNDTYIIWFTVHNRTAHIILKREASPQDQIKAWAIALWTAYRLLRDPLPTSAACDDVLKLLMEVRSDLDGTWDAFMEQMRTQGWDTTISNIETTSGLRIKLH